MVPGGIVKAKEKRNAPQASSKVRSKASPSSSPLTSLDEDRLGTAALTYHRGQADMPSATSRVIISSGYHRPTDRQADAKFC